MGGIKPRRQVKNKAKAPTSENIDLLVGSDNLFRESVDAGHGLDKRARKIFMMGVLLVVIYVAGLFLPSDMLGRAIGAAGDGTGYTFNDFVYDVAENLERLVIILTGNSDLEVTSTYYSYSYTMFRYVVVALAGAGLALSGAVYQGAFRNALVSPSTLGVMSGGSFGMVLWVLMAALSGDSISLGVIASGLDGEPTVGDYLASSYGLALMSFAGCFVVVALVLLVIRIAGTKMTSPIMMIITGQVIGGLIGVFQTLVNYYYVTTDPYGDIAQCLQELQVASFYRSFTWIDILCVGIPLIVTFAVVVLLGRRMMLLGFSETEQRTMGVDTRRMQVAVVGLCTLLTAVIISFCGTVGFVGFLVPHLARRMVGPNFKYLLPAATVMGACFVLGAYVLIECTLGASYATMTGMYISIAGAVVFLVTALKGGGVKFGSFN